MGNKMAQTDFHWPRDQPLYARILHTTDFNVPRRQNTPHTTHERKTIKYTPAEKDRYEKAKAISHQWFRDITTVFLDELDRIVIITQIGLEHPQSPILCAQPIQRINGHNHTTIIMEDGEYELITDWDRTSLNHQIQQEHPTAQYWFALRNTQRPRCPEK
jgi:hypothetical protein